MGYAPPTWNSGANIRSEMKVRPLGSRKLNELLFAYAYEWPDTESRGARP